MGTCTIGVSIAVPEPFGGLLQRRRAGFGDPQAVLIPTHVTLLPPTEVEAAALPEIDIHLAGVARVGRVFEIWLDGTDSFRPLSPVTFVRLVRGSEECRELQERVRSGPLQRDLAFPYHPHVTVAHGVGDAALDRACDELAGFRASWVVPGFSLYQQDAHQAWERIREYRFAVGEDEVRPGAGRPQRTRTGG